MFRIEMLPAAHGDCLWLEWGSDDKIHRTLIDGGPAHTYPILRQRLEDLPSEQRELELLVPRAGRRTSRGRASRSTPLGSSDVVGDIPDSALTTRPRSIRGA